MSIRLVTEVSLDIDSNRKLWLTTSADGVEEEQIESTVESMANAMLGQAIQAAQIVSPDIVPSTGPRIPPTFQEDE